MVFRIVPFMKFLLPVFPKLFPETFPSTFESESKKEEKTAKEDGRKVGTSNISARNNYRNGKEGKRPSWEMPLHSSHPTSDRSTQAQHTGHCLLFQTYEDLLTPEPRDQPQPVALCKLLELQSFETNNLPRFQLLVKLKSP